MRFLRYILVLACTAIGSKAAPVVLDFSRSHTIEDVRRSGLKIKLLIGYKGSHLAYVFEEETDVVVLLPCGRKISQKIKIALIDATDGILTHLDMRGGVMPQDQAYQVAGMFCDSFNLPREKMESWYHRNLGQQYSVDRLGLSPNASYYPRVSLVVGPGYSNLYPWCVNLLVTWNWDKHTGWDEVRASREFSAPAISEISLNPPSGLRYEIADDFKPFVETLNAAFGRSKEANGSQSQGAGAGVVADAPGAVAAKEPFASGKRWWIWGLGFVSLSLLALLWFILRRFRKQPKPGQKGF
jgi:hypothetical protein